jgi:hypothetical protein
VSPEDQVTRLLDSALPDVPQAMLGAPIHTIHRLVRRRRQRIAAATTAAVAVLAVVITAAAVFRPVHRTAPAVTPQPSASVAAHLTPWQLARVARDGTHLTVYSQPAAGTCTRALIPQVVQSGTSVGIGMAVSQLGATSCDPDQNSALMVAVTLDAPLGDRPVIDLSGDAARHVYPDSELPVFPAGAGWREVPGSSDFRFGVFLGVLFGRDDGIEVSITAQSASPVTGTKKGSVTVGRRAGQIYTYTADSYKVVWMVGDQQYTLRVDPSEGKSESLSAFKDLLSSLHWDQGP